MTLTPESVALWLKEHPDFFETRSALLADIQLPHPHGTHAVSLAERQLLALREKNRALEARLAELIGYAETNDGTSAKVHRLALALIRAGSLSAVLEAVRTLLQEDFTVPGMAVRLWGLPQDRERPEFSAASDALRDFVAELAAPHCSHEAVLESAQWIGPEVDHPQSFALVPLRDTETFGAVLMASNDRQRFYPDMGTFYLTRIGELVSAALRVHASPADHGD
ncbi:MAG: DUF484 family protein [Betaproteobacteria bacterium]|nr:DUF484 family protein [Betaproteobacteria bacterium]MDE2625200.1 DUF484 family protein [Betaproteobacteria bacterium]